LTQQFPQVAADLFQAAGENKIGRGCDKARRQTRKAAQFFGAGLFDETVADGGCARVDT